MVRDNLIKLKLVLLSVALLLCSVSEAGNGNKVDRAEISMLLENASKAVQYDPFLFQSSIPAINLNSAEISRFEIDLSTSNLIPSLPAKTENVVKISGRVREIKGDNLTSHLSEENAGLSRVAVAMEYANNKNRVRGTVQYANNQTYVTSSFSYQHQINDLISLFGQFRQDNDVRSTLFGVGLKPKTNLTLSGEVGSDINDPENSYKFGFLAKYRF